ncbi:hypothetical protein ACFDTO_15870 [Microbacteriaceae bacterium 4G12]
MKVVPKDHIVNGIDQLLSALDLLEMNMELRINHTIKHKEDSVMDEMEVIGMHMTHMESKMVHHLEKGNWLKTKLSLERLTVKLSHT